MSHFKFRLETLLKLRENNRDECRARLQQAQEAESILDQQSEELRADIVAARHQSTAAATPGAVNVDALVEYKRYGMVLDSQLRLLSERRKLVADEVFRRREELTEADRQVKVLEKLKQRRQADHARQEHYAEVKLLDEIAQRSGTPRPANS